jgi:hypothetical protein
MVSDEQEEQGYEYNIKIAEKEQALDELRSATQETRRRLEEYEQTMMHSYRELVVLEDGLNRVAGMENGFNAAEEERRYVARMLLKQQEEMDEMYALERRNLEDDCEQLQRERDAFWD